MTRALGAAGAILLAVVPLAAPVYYVNIGSQVLVAAVFALSLNLLVGYAGLTSLGHAVYLGTTAYTPSLTSPDLSSRGGRPRGR